LGDSRSLVFDVICGVLSNVGKLRVLVVDDHAGMRDGISAVVNAQPDMMVAGAASDGQEAIQRFKALGPDVSLLDWNLPLVPGEEVLSTLTTEFPKARFIVITALTDDDCIRRALSLGAQAYLHKDMLRRELVPAIRAVHQGQQYLPDTVSERLKRNN
jgi:two-component system NarL family response regulator